MPSCPECGLDVENKGLCAECSKEKNAKQKKKSEPQSLLNPVNIIILIIIGFLSGLTGVLVGKAIPSDQAPVTTVQVVKETMTAETTNSTLQTKTEQMTLYNIEDRDKHPPTDEKEKYIKWMLDNTNEEKKFLDWRWECVEDLEKWKSIKVDRIKEAFLLTPRENFIRKRNRDRAYEHAYMAIGYGATITDPWVVSTMTEAINPQINHKVLEIGTGSGYQSAVLSQLSNYVYSIEIIDPLARETNEIYNDLEKDYPEYQNIKRKSGDGYFGWAENAPFDRIIVTCAIDHIPPALLQQLVPNGIMVIPVGPPSGQRLLKVTKKEALNGDIYFEREDIFAKGVKFIPFTKSGGDSYSEEAEETSDEA